MKTIQSKLRLFLISISVIGMATFFLVSVGYADNTPLSYESRYYTNNYGFLDHKSYSSNYDGTRAQNDTAYWQALGTTAYKNNYGVSWATSDDGGANWSSFGHTEELFVGQQVKFQFNMYSESKGTHYANILKSWIDWGVGDGESPSFDNYFYSNSKLVSATSNRSLETFESEAVTIGDWVGTAYIRARVTCTESILSTNSDFNAFNSGTGWYDQWDYTTGQYESAFDAYSDYNQGEIEDWKFTVSRRPGGGDPVPEPATFALFGMGLIGLARWGRKKA